MKRTIENIAEVVVNTDDPAEAQFAVEAALVCGDLTDVFGEVVVMPTRHSSEVLDIIPMGEPDDEV